MRVSVYVLSAKWDMSFPTQCDLSVAGKGYGHELFSGCQEAILDFCRDQSCNHFTLLMPKECFNLCCELSARAASLRLTALAHLALSQMCRMARPRSSCLSSGAASLGSGPHATLLSPAHFLCLSSSENSSGKACAHPTARGVCISFRWGNGVLLAWGEEQLPPNPQCRSHHQPVVSDEQHHTHASWVRASGWPQGPCCVKSSGASRLGAQGCAPKDSDATGRLSDQPEHPGVRRPNGRLWPWNMGFWVIDVLPAPLAVVFIPLDRGCKEAGRLSPGPSTALNAIHLGDSGFAF